jgi:hypothetical protein
LLHANIAAEAVDEAAVLRAGPVAVAVGAAAVAVVSEA